MAACVRPPAFNDPLEILEADGRFREALAEGFLRAAMGRAAWIDDPRISLSLADRVQWQHLH
jgi:hypothetical protein